MGSAELFLHFVMPRGSVLVSACPAFVWPSPSATTKGEHNRPLGVMISSIQGPIQNSRQPTLS